MGLLVRGDGTGFVKEAGLPEGNNVWAGMKEMDLGRRVA